MNLKRKIVSYASERYLRLTNPHLYNAFKCPSHLTTKEKIKLCELAKGCSFVAEIGSYLGASACCFASGLEQMSGWTSGKIICIDTWHNDAMSEGERDTWLEFKRNTERYASQIQPVRGFSTDVVGQVKVISEHLDLLFIDGDHSYEGVKADWEAYKRLMRPNSIVIFHDIGWAEGVRRVVNEDVMPLCVEHSSLPNMWWGKLSEQP